MHNFNKMRDLRICFHNCKRCFQTALHHVLLSFIYKYNCAIIQNVTLRELENVNSWRYFIKISRSFSLSHSSSSSSSRLSYSHNVSRHVSECVLSIFAVKLVPKWYTNSNIIAGITINITIYSVCSHVLYSRIYVRFHFYFLSLWSHSRR